MSHSRASIISSSFFFGISSSDVPSFKPSASSSGIFRPKAISFVISVEPMEKVCTDTRKPFSKTDTEDFSAPISTRATPTIFCFSERHKPSAATGEAIMSMVSTPASAKAPRRSSRCTKEYVTKSAFISSLVPRMPSSRPCTSLPSSRKDTGYVCTIFLLFKERFSSASSSAFCMSSAVTSPSALEIIAEPAPVSPRSVAPESATKARLTLTPEDFSAALTAFLIEAMACAEFTT